MFWNVFRMDLRRSFSLKRMTVAAVAVAALLAVSIWQILESVITVYRTDSVVQAYYGAVDFLQRSMHFDAFKVVAVFFLVGLYTGSYCQDENSRYLRMIMSRTDIFTYTRSRFLANLLAILTAALAGCLLFVLFFVAIGIPLVSRDAQGGLIGYIYFQDVAKRAPLLYACMLGLEFGLVAAACGSAGLLVSAWQPNAFVSIGSSGLLFFILISSAHLSGTPFSFDLLIALQPAFSAGKDTPMPVMVLWALCYPLSVTAVCCLLFERRMKRRLANGNL